MKRWFALVLSIVVILTLALPVQSFAAGDQSLEKAIKTAKSVFDIPSNYTFTNSISSDGTKKVYNLNWNNPDTSDGSSISVGIDENGKILNYYKYSPSDYMVTKKLPKISRQDAKKKADDYLKKIDPTLTAKLKYDDSNLNNNMDVSYNLTYYRAENGLPVYNNQVNLSVSRETGALLSYNSNWQDGLTFPAVTGAISEQKAEDFYKANLGLKLVYKYSYVDNVLKTYPAYIPKYDNSIYAVDAITGDRIQLDYGYYGVYYDYALGGAKTMASQANEAINLNPDEQKAVEDASKLISVEEAEKIARGTAFLGLTDEFKLNYSSLYQNWPLRTDYIWNLSFNKPAKDNSSYSDYISVSIDAASGNIVGFNRSTPYKEGATAKYDAASAKAAVEKFLGDNFPEYKKQMNYDELNSNNSQIYGKDIPQNINFRYNRVVNGIEFPDNGVNINFDTVNGVVTDFNLTWYNTTFPAVDKVLSADSVYSKLFSNVGLELQYKMKTPQAQADAKIIVPVPTSQVKPVVKAVYALKPNKPLVIDANTGNLLDSQGKPYQEPKPVSYTDIAGNAAEKQIMVLADNGICLEGTEFKPAAVITQKEFLSLLMKTINTYGTVIKPNSTKAEIDNLYANLTSQGIIKAGEKTPDSAVTREDAVKFIIRALKYDKVADITGLYTCTYKDKSQIDPKLIGYVAIAAGLKIDAGSKGYFNPKKTLTRADAAVILYNYLQV